MVDIGGRFIRKGGSTHLTDRARDRSRSRSCEDARSRLATEALYDYAMGHCSAKRAQRIAEAGIADGIRSRELNVLTKIGTYGANEQNCKRELLGKFADFDLVVPLCGSMVTCMVLPHELFAFMYAKFPNEFVHRFGADPLKLSLFWQTFASTPQGSDFFQHHPHLRDRKHLEYTIPIFSHYDAGNQLHLVSFSVWGVVVVGVGA